jgi:hypothetical protein
MNAGKSGNVGRGKHRQAFGHDSVSRHVKLALEREANKPKRKRPTDRLYPSVADLMKGEKS